MAKFSKEETELEEYRQHLEKVYRLYPGCTDILTSKLGEQDRKLANKLLEFMLERSRLNTSISPTRTCFWPWSLTRAAASQQFFWASSS